MRYLFFLNVNAYITSNIYMNENIITRNNNNMNDNIANEKIRFAALQSSFHKLMNNLSKNLTENINIMALHDINETMEILEAKILNYNESAEMMDASMDERSAEHSTDIMKNNKVINDLTPLFIMYRTLLD
jgi:hypothetical protein